MGTAKICPICGTEFDPQTAFGDQCPRCLFNLGVGLDGGLASAGPGSPRGVIIGANPAVSSGGPRPLTLESGQKLSHYRLVEKIGEGGMGVVWKAEDTVLGRPIAIKFLPADFALDEARRKLFLDEAKLAASVSDARIAHVHELGREGGLDFIVMEYVDGKPLSKMLHGRPLPPHKVADFGHQIAHALSKAHRKSLLHRDLKPANVLVTRDGEVKVVDFGLATLFQRADSTLVSRETKSIAASDADEDRKLVGTLAYMSPEQTRMEKLDARSDIFSLGTILYEMTTGQLPFVGPTSTDVIRSVEKARPRPVHDLLPQVPLELNRIVEKSLAPRRGDRYQSMEDLAVDLKRLGRELDSGSSPSYEDLAREHSPARRKRMRLTVAAGALTLVAIGFGVWQWLGPDAALDERTLLILPMEVRGQTEGADYAGRAFAEAIAAHLAKARDLTVLPIAESGEPGAEAALGRARQSGAGRLLTGVLVRDGKAVQARLSLMDATQKRILWGTEREEPNGDLPTLTSALAKEVVAELGATFPKLYDYPTNLTGGPEMAVSPVLSEALGALRRTDYASALGPTRRLLESFPDEPDAHVLRAMALWGDPGHQEALEASLAPLDRIDPGNPYGPFFRAQLLRVRGDARAAVEQFTELLPRDDLTADLRAYVLRMRGLGLQDLSDIDGCLADMEQAVRLDPTRAWTYQYMSWPLLSAGRIEEAVTAARQAVALGPRGQTYHVLGDILGELGRWEESVDPHARSCELSGTQAHCASYAYVLDRAGREAEALEAAKRASDIDDEAWGTYLLARYYALAGDRAEALRLLKRFLEASPADDYVYLDNNRDLASLQGDPEFEAIVAEVGQRQLTTARQTVADEPDSWQAHHDLGDVLALGLGKWEESVDVYAKSCELSEAQDPCAHYPYALHRVGREAEAREAGRRASEMDGKPWSTYYLACYYALAGDRAEALRLLRRSFELGFLDEDIAAAPDLASLHGDPEFEAIVAETRKRNGQE